MNKPQPIVLVAIGVVLLIILALFAFSGGKSEGTATTTPTTTVQTPGTPATGSGAASSGTTGGSGTATGTRSTTYALKMNEPVSIQGAQFRVTEVTEDDRCPEGVQCAQAGTIRVNLQVTSANGSSQTYPMSLGVPVSSLGYTVVLERVTPGRKAGLTIPPSEYTFFFRVTPAS